MKKMYTYYFKTRLDPSKLFCVMNGTKELVAMFLFTMFVGVSSINAQLPDQFQTQDLVTGLGNATTIKFAPDGRIFILDRYGELIIYKQDTQSTVVAGEISVFHELEDGLLGIAFDPDFENNGYIYLHYSPLGVTMNRVSRFLMEGDDLNLASETILIEWATQRDNYFHSGGDMGFDSQGNLYIATGDNSNHSPWGAFNESDENQSSENTASNTNDFRGKILRITPQPDGTYTIPSGNLFPVGTPNTLPEIYVMGARNPYRIHVDAEFDDWLFWGEVGPDSDEDEPAGMDVGGTAANGIFGEGPVGLDEINLTKQAGNYGWPYFSGNGVNDPDTVGGNDDSALYEYLVTYGNPPYYNDPAAPQNNSVWNTGLVDLPAAQPAWLDFFHRSYMAGPRYKFNPSLTDLQRLPVEFDGLFFFYDFNASKIWTVEMDAVGDILSVDQLAPSVFPATQQGFIDMEIGPDGFLYILAYGAGCCPNNVGTGKLMKVIYTGITTNTPPNAVISADVTNGALPLTVNFSSAGTSDPNGDSPLTYEWDFDTSIPSTDSTDENPSHTYTTAGTFNAQLRVDDGNGGVGVANITITAGNTAAEFTFNSPADGGFYNWDDDITLNLLVSDAEDGDTNGGAGTEGAGIDCTDVDVVPSLGHLTHFHDTPTIDGCSPKVITIASDDGHQTDGQADLFFVLNALYTDVGGFDSQDQIRIYPKRAEAEHFDDQNDTEVIDNTDLFGGGEEALRVNNDSYIVFQGRNLQNITGANCRVTSALSGGSIEFRLGSPTGTLLGNVSVPNTGDLSTWTNVVIPFADPGGKNDLYFVFTNTSVSEDIMDVNYIEFLGSGVSVDNSAPVVNEVRSISTNQIRVLFNEYVTDATAGNPANYQFDNGVSIGSVDLLDDNRTVILTTSTLSPSVEYELTIGGVQNDAGLTMVTANFTFSIFNPVRINAGGNQLNTSYGLFEDDQYDAGGNPFTAAMAIEGTSDDILYHSERYGQTFRYEIPILVSGEYDIRLHFAEIFWGVDGNSGGPGSRVFNVSIEGEEVLSNFDILAETNPATALIKEFDDVFISDGVANIEFTSVTGDAKVSGVEILSPDAFTPSPSISIVSPMDGWDVNQPFEVAFSTRNWNIAVGDTHMHYYVDGIMVGPHYSYDPIIIEGYSEGLHTIRLELFNANHTGTGIFDEVTVNITNTVACNEAPFPDEWTVHELEQAELPHRSVYIYADDDLDGDGLKDIVTGAWWYKNPGTASGNWVRSTIGAPFNNVALVYDFDGDGDMDLLGTQGAYESSDMAWAENDGLGNFTVRTNIPSGTNTFSEPFLAGIAAGQFEAGEPLQIAINWNGSEATGDAMQLLTPAADLQNDPWVFEDLSPDSLGEDINEGDIDGDGDLDLFQGGNWLRNDISDGGTWTTIPTGITYATTLDRAQLADFDRDGDLDAVVGQLGLGADPDRFEFSWFEAPVNPEDPWIRHVLASDIAGSLSVFVADMDFDGDEDIIVGEWLGANRLITFENDLCNSGGWIRQTIDIGGTGFDHHDGARVTDIDNDGDLDIVSIGWDNIVPRIFENTTINSSDPINQNPIVVNPGLQLYNQGSEISLQIEASDPDMTDILTFSATNLPAGLTIDGNSGSITGILGTVTGEFTVTVRATDQEGAFDEQTFTMNIGDFDTLIRINAGGPEILFGDEEWVEDIYFSGGDTFSVTDAIANTGFDAIFQTERNTGATATDLIYEIPVPEPGNFGVRLHFAEIFHTMVGERIFDIDIENGQGQFNNYDVIYQSGGPFTAVAETFLVTVTDGSLTITLSTEIDRAKISGIEILGANNDVPPVVENPG
ncbi:MAG: malectin domain-containing carbohydrate-binding protein, partial [Bacteroidota bacterium]